MAKRTIPKGWHEHPNGGGLIQNTASVADTSFIDRNAQVFGNARVFGNAQVFGNARVFGNAWVSGDAQVSGNAWVSGDAWEKSPLFIQGHIHSISQSSRDQLTIGCRTYAIDYWLENAERIGKIEGYSALDIEIYKLHIAHIQKVSQLLWSAKKEEKAEAVQAS